MTILLISAACLIGFMYLRWRGPVMYEAARSYLYLEALRAGATNHEASEQAALKESEVTNAIYHLAKFHRRGAYRKQVLGSHIWPQIGEAYRRGMSPPLLPDILWQVVDDWSRKGGYPFPSAYRYQLLGREETAYEEYYFNILKSLATRTGLSTDHLVKLFCRIDDAGCRDGFREHIPAADVASTLYEVYMRDGALRSKEILLAAY